MEVALTITQNPMPVLDAVRYALDNPTRRIESVEWTACMPQLSPFGPAWITSKDVYIMGARVVDKARVPLPALDRCAICNAKGLMRIGYLGRLELWQDNEIYAVSDGKRIGFLERVLKDTVRHDTVPREPVRAGWYPVLSATFVPAR